MKKRIRILLLLLMCSVTGAFSQSKTISGGNEHGIIICAQGYIYAWGVNQDGQKDNLLGLDEDAKGYAYQKYYNSPQRVKTGNLTFSQVTAGSGAFNLALSCHKLVYAWGDNEQGACGQGAISDQVVRYPVPVLKGETSGYNEDGTPGGDYLGGVTYIAASTNSGFAIMDDGRVVGWGKGTWNSKTGAAAMEPSYIKDESGKDLTNITHISGGDDNCLLRDANGNLYGIGPWNGNTDDAVTYAVPVLKDEDGTALTGIKMSAAGDVCGFAVSGDGFLWSWGNGGWGNSIGVSTPGTNATNAMKVCSGEYATISKEEYLTDVKEVIGGRGHGAAVTKEGYLVYWGCNDNNGGVAPTDEETIEEYAPTGSDGVYPILARYCDSDGEPDEIVTDAVSISRGDNFDFMVNSKDEYYAWGLNNKGQTGTGETVNRFNCLEKITTIPCDIQDACPTVFLIDQTKCPGEEIVLDCGFVVPEGKEERYFIQWYKDGVLLNTSTPESDKATRLKDIYNADTLRVSEPGTYKVVAQYIGTNIPCDACEIVEATSVVTDMPMPIDTIITEMNCVADPLKPSATDNICFEFDVNNKFYKAGDVTTFALFSTETSTDTLAKKVCSGAGSSVKFCTTGDNITADNVHDNAGTATNDTTYTAWVEDISSFDTYLYKDMELAGTGNDQKYRHLIEVFSDANLKSLDIKLSGYDEKGTTVNVTPIIYKCSKNTNGYPVPGDIYWQASETQTLAVTKAAQTFTIDYNVVLPGIARGTRYFIGLLFDSGNFTLYTTSLGKITNAQLATKVIDSEEFGIYSVGNVAGDWGNETTPYTNIKFGKLTDYDCGRIKLTAKYGCPPCNQPDGLITIASTKEADVTRGVVGLCKGESTTLSVDKVVKAANPDAVFDIQWFDDAKMTTAVKEDLAASASSLDIAWDDLTPGVVKTYYMRIRDNEKPEASSCYVIDSIKVIADTVPVVPEVTIKPWCEGQMQLADILIIAGQFAFTGYTTAISNGTMKDMSSAELLADLQALTAGDHIYSITNTDPTTTCVSEPLNVTVTVNPVPEKPSTTEVSMLKENSVETIAAGATADAGNSLLWYTTEDNAVAKLGGTEDAPNQDKSVAGTYTYYVRQQTEAGCIGDTALVTVVVNDAPKPTVRDTEICVNSDLTLANQVRALSSEYQLYWYTDATAEKGTGSTIAPVFSSATPGVYTYYVSQLNTTTNAESEKAELTVTIYGVATPSVTPTVTYCKDATAASLATLVTPVTSEATYMFADGFEWSNADGTVITNLIPSTDVIASTETVYNVKQTYTIKSSAAVCKGENASVTVAVQVLNAPTGDLTVNYLKSDASDNGGKFKTLTQQNPTVATADEGNSLVWYESDGATLVNGNGSVPTPEYDASLEEDTEYIYYVTQKNSNGCESSPSKVVVTVSSSPMPTPIHVEYCENSPSVVALSATINPANASDDIDNYSLVWYSSNPNSLTTAEAKAALEISAAPTPSVAIADPNTSSQVDHYYVAQKNLKTGAVSRAAELNVTIYTRPVLTVQNPDPVCYPQTIDLNSSSLWLVSQNVNHFTTAWYDEAGTQSVDPAIVNAVSVTSTFNVMCSFQVPTTGELCQSDKYPISVDVQYIKNLAIDGVTTTCPNTTVDLSATTTGRNPESLVAYQWTCVSNGDNNGANAVVGDSVFTTTALAGPAGSVYTYNVVATTAACIGDYASKASITVTIGDGPVEGNLAISEDENTGSNNYKAAKTGVTFYSCGGAVKIDASGLTHTEEDFTWTAADGTSSTGSTLTVPAPAAGVKSAVYKLTYTNNCATGFPVTINYVPVSAISSNTAYEICEGDDFSADLTVSCPENSYVVSWFKDGAAATGLTGTSLNFSPAQFDQNGVYTYTVTNRGCTFDGEIAEGNALHVKRNIKFSVQNKYVVLRDSQLSIPVKITVPEDEEPQTISWKENMVELGSSSTLNLKVTEAHTINVTLSDPDYCEASDVVTVLADARLAMDVTLDNVMCASDSRDLIIDTTGTGSFLQRNNVVLSITETIGDVVKTYTGGWTLSSTDGLLHFNVTPAADAEYTVKFAYNYSDGTISMNQLITKMKSLQVKPAIQVVTPTDNMVCGDGIATTDVNLVSVTPDDVMISWTADDDIISGLDNTSSIKVSPVFDETKPNNYYYKTYYLTATNSLCDPVSAYVNVRVDKPLTGVITGPSVVCEGTSTTLSAAAYDATTYLWSSSDDPIADGMTTAEIAAKPIVDPSEYTVDMTRGECSASDSWTVSVSTLPRVSEVDSLYYDQVEIVMDGMYGTAPFTFWLDKDIKDSTTNSVLNVTYGKHVVHVLDVAGCSTTDTFYVENPHFEPPVVLTPDGNGKNDVFNTKLIQEAYPNAVITIYDRYGKKLAQYKGADIGWDGTYNGNAMPSTDYWYTIEIKEIGKTYNGHFTLLRQ